MAVRVVTLSGQVSLPTATATSLPPDAPDRKAGRDALIVYVIVAVLVTGLVRINITIPAIGHVGSALVSVLFLYAPMLYLARWRNEDIYDYGFRTDPVKKSLGIAFSAIAVIFPIFALGYFAFYEIACHSQLLAHLVPRNMCVHYLGTKGAHAPHFTLAFGEFCLVQL